MMDLGLLSMGSKGFPKKFGRSLKDLFLGTPDVRENVSTLRPEQEGLYNQLVNAGQKQGAGGAFGTAADYYRNLLSDNSADYNSFAAPMMRQYQQDIVPGLSEQFAGMGSGGLSSSGFRNAQVQGATDLAERLGQLRANLRQAGVQGLQNIGQLGLGSYSQNMVTEPGSEGLLAQLGPGLVSLGVGAATGNPMAGMAAGNVAQGAFGSRSGNRVGANTSPYSGGSVQASPQIRQGFRLPNFMEGY